MLWVILLIRLLPLTHMCDVILIMRLLPLPKETVRMTLMPN